MKKPDHMGVREGVGLGGRSLWVPDDRSEEYGQTLGWPLDVVRGR